MNPRSSFLQRHWPFLAAVAFWLALFFVTLAQVLAHSGGRLSYASDDVYIHMAIAKNLVRHGVWGVTPYAFTSCASSIVWPLVIGLTYVFFGVNVWSPLILNLLLSIAVLWIAYRGLRERGRGDWTCLSILVVLILCVPFMALTFDGMEHMLQIFIFLAFARRLMAALTCPEAPRIDLPLIGWAIGLTLVRYEGLFLAGAALLLLVYRRRWKLGAGVLAAVLLPVAVMAVVSVLQGWYPIPTSVLIKSAPFSDIVPEAPIQTLTRPFRFLSGRDYILSLIILLLVSWIAAVRQKPRGDLLRALLPGAFFLLIAFAHGTLISMEWFFRHAAYLVALGIWAVECTFPPGKLRISIPSGWGPRLAAGALALLLAYPLAWRTASAILDTPPAARNIYEMQYQMAVFLHRYYPEGPVAVNDIGAVSYYNDFPLLDLYGLASMDVARAKIGGTYNTQSIEDLSRESGVRVAVVYDDWFIRYGGLPAGWVKAGEWHFTDCFVCGGDSVAFYATDPAQAAQLRADLKEFERELPARVKVELTAEEDSEEGKYGG
jgi:hypothetical protein